MDSKIVGGLVAVLIVIVFASLLRRASPPASGRLTGAVPNPPPPPAADDDNDDDGAQAKRRPEAGEDSDDNGEAVADIVAVTSEGFAVVPDRHAVRLVPPEESGEEWKVGAGQHASHLRGQAGLSMSWYSGDFTGARIVRGDADEGPWRLEALGRDGEYAAFVFETREGADAALAAFTSRGVVKLGEDEDGHPAPPSAEQFEESRRVFLETEQALEMPDEEEPQA